MIEQYTSPAAVNNSQEPWLVGEGVSLSGSIAIPSLDFNFVTDAFPGTVTFTRASTATYFDSAGVLQSAANNVPRLDYNPATLAAQGLLIEEQRANSLLQSEDFATTWTATGSTVSVNAITAPSAATTADKLIADSAVTVSPSSVAAFVRQDITKAATATTYTFSVFAKADEFNAIRLFARDNATSANNAAVSALLTNGTVLTAAAAGGTFTNATVVITNAGSGWYRVALTFTSSTETAIRCIYAVNDSSTTTGDGTKGIYTWGAQLEAGAFPTSYIPTTTTALTRAADVASVNTLSPWYNAAASTIYAEASVPQLGRAARLWAVDDGSTNNMVDATFSISNAFTLETVAGGAYGGGSTATGSITANTIQKTAAVFTTSGNELACLNGGTVGSAALTLPSASLTRLLLGRQQSGVNICGWLRRLTYYPRALSSAELQALTS